MGRKRTDSRAKDFQLPPRVYLHHGCFRFVPREGKKVSLGRDYSEAMRKWASIVKPSNEEGTVSALLDWFIVNVAAKKSARTFSDYKKDAERLKKGVGHIPYALLKPHHVATYRDTRGEEAPVRANRELAVLSATFTAAMEKGLTSTNPCRGVKRLSERARERMIEDHEYQAVFSIAEESVKRMMTLIYSTCQRPEDLLKAGPANVKRIEHEGKEVRVLRVTQGKTGKTVDIILAGDLAKLVDEHQRAATVWPTFVHTRAGKKYTYSGLAAMFRRYVSKVGLSDFGLYDIKSMSATDSYRAGVSLERIQQLLGHSSIQTTEVYIKARLPDVVMPNMREIANDKVGDRASEAS